MARLGEPGSSYENAPSLSVRSGSEEESPRYADSSKRGVVTFVLWAGAVAGLVAVVMCAVLLGLVAVTHRQVLQLQESSRNLEMQMQRQSVELLQCARRDEPQRRITKAAHVPPGVNLGGWLVLEDWFFSGSKGQLVSSNSFTMPKGQGLCLPPKVTQLEQPWPSEGVLTVKLNKSHGPAYTSEALMAHRRSFISNTDLEVMAELGIKTVRIPITWAAFADALIPINAEVYGSHDPENDAAVVPDPFYVDKIAMVTVPRMWLKTFIHKLAKRGMKALLDLHSMPGGSAEGTFNGIWPLPPKFWLETDTIGKRETSLMHAGQLVAQAMIDWVQGFNDEDVKSIAGVSCMNEPAHMSNGKSWASEEQILSWMSECTQRFRTSNLSPRGVKLYVQLIETAFKDYFQAVSPWWHSTFSTAEQISWAVMDRHHYNAWAGPWCSGRTVGGGAYFCDQPMEAINKTWRTCIDNFAGKFSTHFTGLKTLTEFSIGTYDQAQFACTDRQTQLMFLQEQVRIYSANGIEAFFWTWRMPYGPTFEPGWSLKFALDRESPSAPFTCALGAVVQIV